MVAVPSPTYVNMVPGEGIATTDGSLLAYVKAPLLFDVGVTGCVVAP